MIKKNKFSPYISIFQNNIHRFIIIFLIAIFIYNSAWKLHLPGLEYDETLFINAALLGPGEELEFIYKRIFGMPVLVMRYIGALKSYFYLPIFTIFGVSVTTIRLPMIILSAASILINYAIMKQVLNHWWALGLTALIATDPLLMFNSKLDYGPVSMMIFLKSASLLYLLKFTQDLSKKSFLLFITFCLFGIYDKLNFVWYVLAIIPATMLVYYDRFITLAKPHLKLFIFFAVLAIIFGFVFGFVFVLPIFKMRELNHQIIVGTITSYIWAIDATNLYGFTINGGMSNETVRYMFFLSLSVIILGFLLIIPFKGFRKDITEQKKTIKFILMIITASLLILFQISITEASIGGQNHFLILYPFHFFVIVGAGWLLKTFFDFLIKSSPRAKLLKTIGFIIILSLFACQISGNWHGVSQYHAAFQDNNSFKLVWNPAIYQLAETAQKINPDRIISSNWGTHNQIQALAAPQDRIKYLNRFNPFVEMHNAQGAQRDLINERVFKELFQGNRVLLIQYADIFIKNTVYEFINKYSNRMVCQRIAIQDANTQKDFYELFLCDAR
ncbi:MAG: glycosyltransferase family 39 protein [Anaerolineae bacterium]|nr:glycosyltransferase family 39 protein [Anaerolineae bacterium]